MFRFAADHNLHEALVRELRRKLSELDVVSVRKHGLARASDSDVLSWAADEGRILLTHDRQTMPRYAYERVRANLPMPGAFVIETPLIVGPVLEDLFTIIEVSDPAEWESKVEFLPYKR